MDDLFYRRCKEIKAMLDHPLFQSAVNEVQEDIKNAILDTKPEEKEVREDLYYESKGFDRLLGRLTIYANNVTMTEGRLRHG